jgi:hypothetical protein
MTGSGPECGIVQAHSKTQAEITMVDDIASENLSGQAKEVLTVF